MQTHLFHRTYNECKRGTEKRILLGSTNSVCLQVGTVLKLASSRLNMTNTSTCARDYMSVHNDNPELTVNQNNIQLCLYQVKEIIYIAHIIFSDNQRRVLNSGLSNHPFLNSCGLYTSAFQNNHERWINRAVK